MTSEAALMNRGAVALAADSATTVTYWDHNKNQLERRFFKRANKIFNIVSGQPVGLMTYDSAVLQGMPWEVLAKAYRDAQRTPMDKLRDYATSLFSYLEGNRNIFSAEYQEKQLMAAVFEGASNLGGALLQEDDVKNAPDAAAKIAAATTKLTDIETFVRAQADINADATQIREGVVRDDLPTLRAGYKSSADGQVLLQHFNEGILDRIVELAVFGTFKPRFTTLQTTGIVVAGYGSNEYLPQLEQYKVHGLLKNKLLFVRLDDHCASISSDNLSHIVPIAQSGMLTTFVMGADVPTLEAVDDCASSAIDGFRDALIQAGHLDGAIDTSSAKDLVIQGFREQVNDYVFTKHAQPMRQIIGMLAPEELAELAETFVSIESLKERVTQPTESVSGPIDVAVISKGDGFIWIKRKHYFDPKLNPRYTAKKQQELG